MMMLRQKAQGRQPVWPGERLRSSLLGAAIAGLFAVSPAGAVVLPYESTIRPLQLVQTEHLTAAPAVDGRADLFFGQPDGGAITRMAPDGEQLPWAQLPGVRGQEVLPDGRHVLLGPGTVVEVDGRGHLVRTIRPQPAFVSPNSAVSDGFGYFVTDRGSLDPTDITPRGAVWYVSRYHDPHVAAAGLLLPSGIALGLGGSRLYVLESSRNRVLSYPVTAEGELGAPRVFATLPPAATGGQIGAGLAGSDLAGAGSTATGLVIDASGDLWISHFGAGEIVVLDPTGALLRRYPAGVRYPTGLAFGGPDLDQLYVTGAPESPEGSGGLFRLDIGLPGIGETR